jgi:hypothetical protein
VKEKVGGSGAGSQKQKPIRKYWDDIRVLMFEICSLFRATIALR